MSHRVCPWWMGYVLVSPLRRLTQSAAKIVDPYVREGMMVLEVGPGMGFFTLELARRVGSTGKVIAVDVQSRMLDALRRRLRRRKLQERVDLRLASPNTMNAADLSGRVDLIFAFAVVHELPDPAKFFAEATILMKNDARLLIAEPSGHVGTEEFAAELQAAEGQGLRMLERPVISRSQAAVLGKS